MQAELPALAHLYTYLHSKTGLTESQFAQLATTLTIRQVPKGTVLLRAGEICSEVLFVSAGLLRAYKLDKTGREHLIQFAPEEWWISDRSSFYFQEPAELFIDAIEHTVAVSLNAEFFARAEALVPDFVPYNTRALHNFIRFMQRRVNLLLGSPAEDRYLDFIQLYPNLTLRLPQWMIASYLGITRESLSRVRRELASRNFQPRS